MFGVDFDRVLGPEDWGGASTQQRHTKSRSHSHIVLLGCLICFVGSQPYSGRLLMSTSALVLRCQHRRPRSGVGSRRLACAIKAPQLATVSRRTISSATASARAAMCCGVWS